MRDSSIESEVSWPRCLTWVMLKLSSSVDVGRLEAKKVEPAVAETMLASNGESSLTPKLPIGLRSCSDCFLFASFASFLCLETSFSSLPIDYLCSCIKFLYFWIMSNS